VTDVNVKVDRIVHLASILGCTTSCLPLSYHQPFGLVIFRWIRSLSIAFYGDGILELSNAN
jgi:hypothetical protein